MGKNVQIGGPRLGSENKMKAYLHGYERSTHDLSFVWRSTMAAGTLVPFMNEVLLPGDTMEINLDVLMMTHPTVGPCLGTMKIQLDVFQIPLRLYNAKLYQNRQGVGMNMQSVALPQIQLMAYGRANPGAPLDNQQINSSCLLSYLGIRGLGFDINDLDTNVLRDFNAVPFLAYWDIYKQYYANKQEQRGFQIHKDVEAAIPTLTGAVWNQPGDIHNIPFTGDPAVPFTVIVKPNSYIQLIGTFPAGTEPEQIRMALQNFDGQPWTGSINQLFQQVIFSDDGSMMYASNPTDAELGARGPFLDHEWTINLVSMQAGDKQNANVEPSVTDFPLENIDIMRETIQSYIVPSAPYVLKVDNTSDPYYGIFQYNAAGDPFDLKFAKQYAQEGLGLRTYLSDLHNNWIDTEYITGVNGIADVTAIDTSSGSFTMDDLNMSKKLYIMLSRIALSAGDYQAWVEAVYDEEYNLPASYPIYIGGMSTELVFDEVVSNAATTDQPLGTLAGRGKMGGKKRGGKITARAKGEPSMIMGIISIVPRLDYSQGNEWHTRLETMDDLHKPQLDEIGFQDLVTDQLAWWDTRVDGGSGGITYRSAGKQPAWINYMTNVNKTRGNFADQTQQMWMTLNRRYTPGWELDGENPRISDLTTYIDPVKYNQIFSYTRRDGQNYWAQIKIDNTARRKMSAKIIPNL